LALLQYYPGLVDYHSEFRRKDGTRLRIGYSSHPDTMAHGEHWNLVVFDSIPDKDDLAEGNQDLGVKDQLTPVSDESAAVGMFAGVAEDVASGHETPELVAEREKKFQRILTSLPDVTWTADGEGRYSYLSPRVANVQRYSNKEIYAAAPGLLHSKIHPEDRDRVCHAYDALFREQKIFDEQYRIAYKTGDWIWIHDRAVSTHVENGTAYTNGFLTDIIDRKAAEANSQSKTAFLEALVNSTMDGILVVDPRWRRCFLRSAQLRSPLMSAKPRIRARP
jgi:PAS domain S-box-containing protein